MNSIANIHKTTDLEVLRKNKRRFMWGSIAGIHDLGEYTFVDYVSTSTGTARRSFHVYVGGKDTHTSCDSLDEAMIYAVAWANLEINAAEHMAEAANKILLKG